jgi:hypothetical protein
MVWKKRIGAAQMAFGEKGWKTYYAETGVGITF